MAFNNKNKSRLPQPAKTVQEEKSSLSKLDLNFDENERPRSNNSQNSERQTYSGSGSRNTSDRSTKSVSQTSTISTGRETKNLQNKSQVNGKYKQTRDIPPKTMNGPLSKAMQRKPQLTHRSYETYADEQVESVSQKLRGKTKSDQQKRREALEKQVQEAEAQIHVLTELLDKREKFLQETKENAEQESSALQETISDQEEKLITNGIDPVTGEKVPITDEDKKKESSNRKFNKKYIQEMREKLRLMNSKTEAYLTDIENTVNYLDSLEDASTRAGPVSDDVQKIVNDVGPDDFISKVIAENNPKKQTDGDSDSNGDDCDHDDDDHDELDEENALKNKFDEAKNIPEGHLSSKLFITRQESESELNESQNCQVSVAPSSTNAHGT